MQILIASLCGGMLGIERERKNKSAGFRTYILVCLGGCLAEILSEYICAGPNPGDPTRIAAGVVGGIGFLCGGVIIFHNNKLNGVTSATHLWCASIIGMAIGYKLYLIGIISTVCIIIVSHLFVYVEKFLKVDFVDIKISFKDMQTIWDLKKLLEKENLIIYKDDIPNHYEYIVTIKNIKKIDVKVLYKKIKRVKGANNIVIS